MISGVNRVYSHEGRDYHIQAEDLGVEHACIEVRVYDGGTVLWRKRLPYAEILEKKLPKAEPENGLVPAREWETPVRAGKHTLPTFRGEVDYGVRQYRERTAARTANRCIRRRYLPVAGSRTIGPSPGCTRATRRENWRWQDRGFAD